MCFVFFVLNGLSSACGQYYALPDSSFRNYLYNTYPFLLNAEKELIIASANSFTGAISCPGLGIRNLDGLQYFHQIYMINCSDNPVDVLPPLDHLTNLRNLWALRCQLSQLPEVSHLTSLEVLDVKSNNLTALPSLAGLTSLTYLDCSYNQLTSLPDLSALGNLEKLYCYNNQLVSLPPLTGLQKLKVFECGSNRLSSLPDLIYNVELEMINCDNNFISALPVLTPLTQLKDLIISNNRITLLQDLSAQVQLTTLIADHNQLRQIPDLSGLVQLTKVQLHYNQLSFEQLLPQTSSPVFSPAFIVSPQNPIDNASTEVVVQGEAVSISAGVDKGVTSNLFTWYRNGTLLQTTSTHILPIDAATSGDAGEYSCVMENTTAALAGIQITVKTVRLEVGPCINATDYRYSITANSCRDGADIEIDETTLDGKYKPLRYHLVSPLPENSLYDQKAIIRHVKAGSYHLDIVDQNGCSLHIHNFVYVPRPSDCEHVLTPNGDGVDDLFYIDQTGYARIYNKSGKLLREFQAPGYWDGTDNYGQLQPLGLYIIRIDEKEQQKVLLID